MRLILSLIISLILYAPAFSSVDFEDSDAADCLTQADGLSSDLNGANQKYAASFWFKLESETGGDRGVFGKWDFAGNQRQYEIVINATTELLRCSVSSSGSASVTSTSTDAVTTGTWFHLGCDYDDTQIKAIMNGATNGTPTAHTAGLFNGTATFKLGCRGNTGNNNYIDGVLDDACLWATNLTDAEWARIYQNKGVKGFCRQIQPTNLRLYCALEECADGTTCTAAFKCTPGSNLSVSGTPVGSAEEILSYP